MKFLAVLAVVATPAFAFERCYIEPAPAGKSTCSIASLAATYTCAGQDKKRTADCVAADGTAPRCELRPGKQYEPPEIWCSPPLPSPTDSGITVTTSGSVRRDPRAYERTPADSIAPEQACASLLTTQANAFAYQQYQTCLIRERAIRNPDIKVPPPAKKLELKCKSDILGTGIDCKEK